MHSRICSSGPWLAVVALAVVSSGARAQTSGDSDWNHVGVDFRLGLNIKARFSNIGGSAALPVPPAVGGVDHTYNDGFVRLDSSGDKGGVSWNWSYQNASQVPGNDTLLMHTASSLGNASSRNDDPRLGFDANFARDLAHFGWGRLGVKLAFGYTDLDIRDSQPSSGSATLVTDAYPLGGITPPAAPYTGSFNGPGPVIGDTPTRTITMAPGGAVITGSRRIDAALYDLRLGPFLELPLGGQFACQFGGGLALGVADSTFSFSEVTTAAGGSVQAAGSNHRLDSLPGFYAEAQVAYQIMPEASLFLGGQFQYLGEFSQTAEGRGAQLDLRHSIFFVAGVQWHF